MTGSTRNGWLRLRVVAIVGVAAITLSGCSLIGNILSGGEGVVEGEGVATDAFDIKVGDYLNDATAENEVTVLPLVDCSEPHDSEVFWSALMDDGAFPGETAISDFTNAECVDAFGQFVGLPYDESTLYYASYQPTVESWAGGDREILCTIHEVDAGELRIKTTGSLEGAAR